MTKHPRHIVGQTDHMGIANRATAYLNERFPLIGAGIQPSGRQDDCQLYIMCHGPISVHDSSAIVEACRAYITAFTEAADAAKEN